MARGPWPVGTLLAYRIMSSDSDFVQNSVLWNKYVLLRVVKVDPFFVSDSKFMAVCLYDWTGDSLPNPEIVNELSFTYFSLEKPLLAGRGLDFLTRQLSKADVCSDKKDELLTNVPKPRRCTFVLLDWRCCKGIDKNAVFTSLGCDPAFADNTPAIFYENAGGITLTHSIPFDVMLVRRFCAETA